MHDKPKLSLHSSRGSCSGQLVKTVQAAGVDDLAQYDMLHSQLCGRVWPHLPPQRVGSHRQRLQRSTGQHMLQDSAGVPLQPIAGQVQVDQRPAGKWHTSRSLQQTSKLEALSGMSTRHAGPRHAEHSSHFHMSCV